MSVIAEALVRLRPDTTFFRAEAAAGIKGSLAGVGAGLGASSLKAAAGFAGITTAAAGVAVALREIVGGAGNFERELDLLEVASGATADEMERLQTLAEELGADIRLPGISAGDAAAAMNELAKAGLSVEQTLTGVTGTLQLAVAAETDVANAAAIAGGALNVFGLEGTEAAHVADLLAGASIAAQGDIGDMALALQQSGAVARQTGLSIEQTVGAIALLAKNGVLGSDAGTSLRTTLLRLIPTTQEARRFVEALGIQMDENRTLGEQLPDVIDQYARALNKLTPALQQQALTQIFGTDAIRAASIFTREGAAGLDQMTRAADRVGAANELSTARTKGTLGAFENLGSQAETAAIKIGEHLNPALESMAEQAATGFGRITDLIVALEELGEVDLPDWLPGRDDDTFSDLFGPSASDIEEVTQKLLEQAGAVERVRDTVRDLRSPDTQDVAESLLPAGLRAQGGIEAHRAGLAIGQSLNDGVAAGIRANAQSAVDAARATLANVARQGAQQVRTVIAQAQQGLTSLGQGLAADAAAVIDTGPIMNRIEQVTARAAAASRALGLRRQREAVRDAEADLAEALRNAPIEREIQRLQDELDRDSNRDDRQDVQRSLRDAQEALAAAQKSAQVAGPLTEAQQTSNQRFLRPFREDVQDAKEEVSRFQKETTLASLQRKLSGQTDKISESIADLREEVRDAREALVESQQAFATEGLVTSLRKAATEQKETVTRGINDTIAAFNAGHITLPELNRKLARLLAANGIDYRNAGSKLGTAFVEGFEAKLKAINAQAKEILAGPFVPNAGLLGQPASPAQAQRDADTANANARANLDKALLEQGSDQTFVLTQIRDLIAKRPPLATAADKPGRIGGR